MKPLLAVTVATVTALLVGSASSEAPQPTDGAMISSLPTVQIAISLPQVYAGETATLRWNAKDAASCRAWGKWSGAKPKVGEQQVGPLTESGVFGLACANSSGETSRSVGYRIDPNVPSGSGRFDLSCSFSHSLRDDPIVFPSRPGASHMHDFFGFRGTDADSTPAGMRARLLADPSGTTCTEEGDKNDREGRPPAANASAYWVPALYLNGQKIDAHHVHVYYRQELNQPVTSFPFDFRMIGGDANASPEQARAAGIIKWWCGAQNNSTVDRVPSDCGGEKSIHAEIRFPACWDGRPDSSNHKDHLAYRTDRGQCPVSHPRKLPRILVHAYFRVIDMLGRTIRPRDTITLASGGMWTMHADYLFAWDPFRLDFLVHNCLNAKVDCKADPPEEEGGEVGDSPAGDGDSPAGGGTSSTGGANSPVGGGDLPAGGGNSPAAGGDPPPVDGGQSGPGKLTIEILSRSPETPLPDGTFSVRFALENGAERIELGRIQCVATVDSRLAKAEQEAADGVGTCVWRLPSRASGTIRATLRARVDGSWVEKTIEAEIG